MPYKKKILDNGLRIIGSCMPRMQSVALGIWLNVGGRYENKDNKGISHFLEHMLFKGSRKYSCQEIKESIEGLGGALNGFTSEELTCYLVKIPARHLDLALGILSDMVLHPLLSEEDFNKEKPVILEEIKMYKDLPQMYVHDLLDELLWPEQPLGMSVAGSFESVNKLERQDLASFRQGFYTPSNIVISVAGAFKYSALTDRVKGIFSKVKDGQVNKFMAVTRNNSNPQLKLLDKDTEQTHLAMGFHSLKREHPLKYALTLLNIIMGANMSSRLFNEVREKRGLAYEIGTQVKRYSDVGAFVVHAGIDNTKVTGALSLILNELAKPKTELVTADELRRAKDFYLGQLMLSLEDTMDHMLWIGESTASLDKTYPLDEVIKEVNKVNREEVREAAKYIFQEENLNLALIGPLKNSEQDINNHLHIN